MESTKSNKNHAMDVDEYLEVASESDETERKIDLSNEIDQIDRKIEIHKSKLLNCRVECEQTQMEIYHLSQLKDKGLFVLKNIQSRNDDLQDDLKQIHCNYVNCVNNNSKGLVQADSTEVEELTKVRDRLKEQLAELKTTADKNAKILVETNAMIMVQEKKNIALSRKLKKILECESITPDLREKIWAVLSDPRITKPNIHDDN